METKEQVLDAMKNLLNMIENKDTEKMQAFLTKVRKNIE